MTVKPMRGLFCLAILVSSALLVGCGSSSCDARLTPGTAGACAASSSSSGSGSGTGTGTGTGTGSNPGPFTIGGTVTGLTGTGLVLEDNGADDLTISASGPFTFKTAVAGGGAYKVTVKTQPSNQPLPCSVSNGTGTATANVPNVQVTCGNTFTVSGTVSGLQGANL